MSSRLLPVAMNAVTERSNLKRESSMLIEVVMPRLNLTMQAGEIAEWLKAEGEYVDKGEPLFVVIGDKATIEVEALQSGYLKKILAETSIDIPVNQVVAYLGDADDVVSDDMLRPTLAEPEQGQPEATSPAKAPQQSRLASGRVQASPVAKRLAKEMGIDLTQVVGTGRDGLIGKDDVLAFKEQVSGAAPSAGAAPEVPVASEVRLSGIKKTVAERMKTSYLDAPHIALSMSCRMQAASALRAEINDSLQGEGKITFTDMLIKAVAEALKTHTLLNAQFQEDRILVFGEVNIGVAVASEGGLVVPVIRHADQLSLAEISKALGELAERVRTGKQRMEDLSGGTFTISNLGMYGIDFFKPIINPGQAAILGVGAIKNEAVIQDDGSMTAQPTMMLTLSCDHRIVDGVDGAEFLSTLKQHLENPAFMVEG